jgi:hypothetical protein
MPNSTETRSAAAPRQATLIDINLRWLRQALALIAQLDENLYSAAPSGFAPYRVGPHIRHIVDFYRCFFKGLEGRRIDYNSRDRDRDIETNRSAASNSIRNLIRSFEYCSALRSDSSVLVRPEETENCASEDAFMRSSVSRELQALSSHTIHHFALIAITLRLHGVAVDPKFGMAPSTLRFLASQSQQSEEAA